MDFRRFSVLFWACLLAGCLICDAFKYENCPGPISVDTGEDSAKVAVSWPQPYLSGVGQGGSVSQTVSHDPGEEFPIGLTRINYLAINMTDYRDLQICTFVVTVHDPVPPVFIECPSNVTDRLEPGQEEMEMDWDPPQARDNSGFVQVLPAVDGGAAAAAEPGANFTAGTVRVAYTARDKSGNRAVCEFPVVVVPFVTTTTAPPTTATTTAKTTATTSKVSSSGKGKGANSHGGSSASPPGGPGAVGTAGPVDWRAWTSRGVIALSVLCPLCFALIAAIVCRRYRAGRRLGWKLGATGGGGGGGGPARILDEEAYPSSPGEEEYDVWEDPPGGPTSYKVGTGNPDSRRLNKAEVRPLLVAGGNQDF